MKECNHWLRRGALLLAGAILLMTGANTAFAGPLKIDATLIWATNDEKPKDKDFKEIDPTLGKKLKKLYKWRNFFEISRKTAELPAKEIRKVVMSDQCYLEIKNLDDGRVEVKLWGKSKLVSKCIEPLPPGQHLILGGDDKNDTAWLIALKQVEDGK